MSSPLPSCFGTLRPLLIAAQGKQEGPTASAKPRKQVRPPPWAGLPCPSFTQDPGAALSLSASRLCPLSRRVAAARRPVTHLPRPLSLASNVKRPRRHRWARRARPAAARPAGAAFQRIAEPSLPQPRTRSVQDVLGAAGAPAQATHRGTLRGALSASYASPGPQRWGPEPEAARLAFPGAVTSRSDRRVVPRDVRARAGRGGAVVRLRGRRREFAAGLRAGAESCELRVPARPSARAALSSFGRAAARLSASVAARLAAEPPGEGAREAVSCQPPRAAQEDGQGVGNRGPDSGPAPAP